jgi:hypothetical protein
VARKLLPPNITIWWVPEDPTSTPPKPGIANVDAPTAAEINAGTNISCAMVADFTLGWTERDTDDSAGLCDDANVSNPLRKNYESTLTFFLDENRTDATSIYNKVQDLFQVPLSWATWYSASASGRHGQHSDHRCRKATRSPSSSSSPVTQHPQRPGGPHPDGGRVLRPGRVVERHRQGRLTRPENTLYDPQSPSPATASVGPAGGLKGPHNPRTTTAQPGKGTMSIQTETPVPDADTPQAPARGTFRLPSDGPHPAATRSPSRATSRGIPPSPPSSTPSTSTRPRGSRSRTPSRSTTSSLPSAAS